MNRPIWKMLENRQIDNKYHLMKWLGEGGCGAVFHAYEVVHDRVIREVALKLIPTTPDTLDRNLYELESASKLQYPHLLQCFTSGIWEDGEDDYLYIAMELADQTLRSRLVQTKLSEAEIQKIICDVCRALNYMHTQSPPWVHRDVKPANIFQVRETWKLGDFGLTRIIDSAKSHHSTIAAGTPTYAAPEAFRSQSSPFSDIWALGILIVDLFTGRSPFERSTHEAMLNAILKEEPQGLEELPPLFQPLARGCLHKDPTQRYTAQKILEYLDNSISEATKPSESKQHDPFRRKSSRLIYEPSEDPFKPFRDPTPPQPQSASKTDWF